jgi:hypothetical protein
MPVSAWVFSLALCSTPLVCVSSFVPVACWVLLLLFPIEEFEMRYSETSSIVLFGEDGFGYQGVLCWFILNISMNNL